MIHWFDGNNLCCTKSNFRYCRTCYVYSNLKSNVLLRHNSSIILVTYYNTERPGMTYNEQETT